MLLFGIDHRHPFTATDKKKYPSNQRAHRWESETERDGSIFMLLGNPSLPNEEPLPHFLFFFSLSHLQFLFSQFLQKPLPHSFSQGSLSLTTVQNPTQRLMVVCEVTTKKADSAVKRARLSEKRRVYNKARKSEIRTRMRKVLEALEGLKKKPEAQAEETLPVEKLIGEAYSVIDRAVKMGTLHRNTGANRKSRLARRKKVVEIHHGWYTPVPEASSV